MQILIAKSKFVTRRPPASLVSFSCRYVFDEIIALLGQSERLGADHFKSGSAIAEIAFAPFRIV